jgi:ketosteroid isomerase-like protein
MKGTFQMTPGKVVRANDIAILFSDWTLAATAPDGSSIQLSGQTMDVVRRQADGRWLIVIDSPFGAAGATA